MSSPSEPFEVSEAEAETIVRAQRHYTKINDEVALATTLAELQALDARSAAVICNHRDLRSWPPLQFYSFDRIEADDKTRKLVALSAKDKLWTTAHMLMLHRLYVGEFSPHSYGHRVAPGLVGGNLFKPWLTQWKAFTGALSEHIFDREHDDHHIIKIDVKSFYSSVDLGRLEVKLHEGPTAALKAQVEAMTPCHRGRYREVCGALIDVCKRTERGTVGLPQGPAFARYLAEVYLLDLDQFVELTYRGELICYARYVDDIFLILDAKSDHEAIERAVVDHLGRVGLRTNPVKHFSGPTSQYRQTFLIYRNDTKYFIDQVSRRFRYSSEDEIEQASKKLMDLITGEFGEGLEPAHLNFFYTHLHEDAGIHGLKQKYEQYVIRLKEGRGALFANFWSFFLNDLTRLAVDDAGDIVRLTGLRREVFLNALLGRVLAAPVPAEALTALRSMLAALSVDAASTTERELILCAMVAEPAVADAGVLEAATDDDVLQVLTRCIRKRLPDAWATRLDHILLRRPFSEFVTTLYSIVFTTTISATHLEVLSKLFVDRVLEQVGSQPEKHRFGVLRDQAYAADRIGNKFYQLCCLASFSKPNLMPAQIAGLWTSMVGSYNELTEVDIGQPVWVGKLAEASISDVNVNMILVTLLGDGFLPGTSDRHRLFATYHEYLTLCQLAPAPQLGASVFGGEGDDRRRAILTLLERDGSEFLRWILDDAGQAEFYPTRPECLENVVRNDLILLRRGPEILVRAPSARLDEIDFSYLPEQRRFGDGVMASRYSNVVFRYVTEGYVAVAKRFEQCRTLLDVLRTALEVLRQATDFAVSCRGSSRQPNVFASDARLSVDGGRPLVPYTMLGDHLIYATGQVISARPNDLHGLRECVLERIQQSDLALLGYASDCNMNGRQLVEGLATFDDAGKKLSYLGIFATIAGSIDRPGIHDFEYAKAAAILQWLKHPQESEAVVPPVAVPLLHLFLQRYLSTQRRAEARRLLLFGVEREPRRETLAAVYRSVSGSVVQFLSDFEYDVGAFDLPALLEQELAEIVRAAREFLGAPVSDDISGESFVPCRLKVDRVSGDVELDGEIVASRSEAGGAPDPYIYLCDPAFGIHGFRTLAAVVDARMAASASTSYLLERSGKKLVVIIGSALAAAYELIVLRRAQHHRVLVGDVRHQKYKGFFVNTRRAGRALRDSYDLPRARGVLMAHHQCSEASAEDRLVRWLLCLPEEHRPLLLKVIGAHEVIRHEDHVAFIDALEKRRQRSIFLSIKRSEDLNGTHRLLQSNNRGQSIVRGLRLDQVVDDVIARRARSGPDRLVVLADIGISGGQMSNAMREYYLADRLRPNYEKSRKYHVIGDEKRFGEFKVKLRLFKRVDFVFALYTDEAAQRLQRDVCEELLGLSSEQVTFTGRRISHKETILGTNTKILVRQKEQFIALAKDVELLRGIFDLSSERAQQYQDNATDERLSHTNLVARQNSMPKLAAELFQLTPTSDGVPPLFNRIGEHGEYR